jgi:hypothetical protein
MINLEADFKRIVKNVMGVYQDELDNFIRTKPEGSLTDADIIVMNMNIIMGVTTNMYYTLKEILPTTVIDFDYLKATIINNLVDNFEKVKEYEPKQRFIPLTLEQVKEVKDKGFTMIKMPDGKEKKVTEQDILTSKEDAAKVLDHAKKEAKDAINTPKIIMPGDTPFPGRPKQSAIVV